MKSTRQNDIIRIISDREIEKQEELAGELRALGYQVTQATISRDIKDLHLIKVIGESGKYKGLWYMSDAFCRGKVLGIMMHKDALPKALKSKLGIK